MCRGRDFAAAPALLGSSDANAVVQFVGVVTLALGVLTVVAAIGLARGRTWAGPLAVVTRIVDVVAALPGLGEGAVPAVGVVVTIALSAVAIYFVVTSRRSALAAH